MGRERLDVGFDEIAPRLHQHDLAAVVVDRTLARDVEAEAQAVELEVVVVDPAKHRATP